MRLGKFGKVLHYDNTSLGIGNIQRFTIFEIKYLFGIIVNVFNTDNQDRFHSHAFHAWSWMVRGHYYEEVLLPDGHIKLDQIKRSRFIPRNHVHQITKSTPSAISVTFEGPWESTWCEIFDNKRVKIYTWGRQVLFDSKHCELFIDESEMSAKAIRSDAAPLTDEEQARFGELTSNEED